MAQTTLISSISRSTTYPVSVQATADNCCGTLSLIIPNAWSKQMLMELPTINISIFMEDGTKLKSFNINMTTVNNEIKNVQSTDAYSIPIYDIPESFTFSIIPLFDKFALSAHNHNVENGNIEIFNTSSGGVVDTDIEDYSSEIWTTDTQTFNVKIVFDDSNISASGGSGGGGGGGSITVDTQVLPNSINPVQNRAIYDFVNSSVSTNTAYFIGTFNSVADLEAYSGSVSNNDYAFVIGTDSDSNTIYNRYKYNSSTETWEFEYALNNSSFTAAEWETIQSGLTAQDKTNYNNHLSNTNNPHFVTKSQIGLGNVDNTSDENKPISTAMQTALDAKSDKNATVSNIAYDTTNKKLTKTINGNTTDIVSASTLKTDMSLNNVGNFKAVSTVASQGLNDTEKSNARANINAQENLVFDGTYNSSTNKVATQSTVSESQAKQDAEIEWIVNTGVKNLVELTPNTYTMGNVRVTINSDGTVSASLTSGSTANTTFSRAIKNITSLRDRDLILSGCPSGGSYSSGYALYISDDGATKEKDEGAGVLVPKSTSVVSSQLAIIVRSGTTISGTLTFKPMIRPAAITDPTFQPYALPNPVLTPALIKQVDEGPKNFVQLGFTSTSGSSSVPATTNNNNGTITVNGSRVGDATILVQDLVTAQASIVDTRYTLPAGNYVIAPTGNANIGLQVYKHDGTNMVGLGNAKREALSFTYSDTDKVQYPYICIRLYCDGNFTFNNFTFMPMVCTKVAWAVSQKFVPYCPTMQEMYQMILALQSGGNRSLSLRTTETPVAEAEPEEKEVETDAGNSDQNKR